MAPTKIMVLSLSAAVTEYNIVKTQHDDEVRSFAG